MIVWGGVQGSSTRLNTGGNYNPGANTWAATSTVNAPSARGGHAAVWTGSEMIVWGGSASPTPFNTGGRYNPSTNVWTATSTNNAPEPRSYPTAVWTGHEMIVWGGFGSGTNYGPLNTGGKYDPATDSWTPTNTVNAPEPRYQHTAVWTGHEMIVWGGGDNQGTFPMNTGGRYDPTTDTWTPTSTTNAPDGRDDHTAIWTGSEMIVWGGWNHFGFYNTGAKYNPVSDTWTTVTTTNAPIGRNFHTAVWTGNEMIVWGGFNYSPLQTGGRYNPAADSWRATNIGDAPSARALHTAIWTGSEMILWSGWSDYGTNFSTGARYGDPSDTSPGLFAQVGSMNGEHSQHTAILMPEGKVLVTGGRNNNGLFPTAELFDPVSETWMVTDSPATPRFDHTATLLSNKVLLVGGTSPAGNTLASTEYFDLTVSAWTAGGDLIQSRTGHTATLLVDGTVLVAGGFSKPVVGTSGTIIASAELYTTTGQWIATGALTHPRVHHTATLLPNGKVLVTGGIDPSGFALDAELYNPMSGTWTATGNPGHARWAHTATLLPNGNVLVAGGIGAGGAIASAELYDPATGTWSDTGSLISPRVNHTATLRNGAVLVAGGLSNATTELYDVASGIWMPTGSLSTPREFHTATVLPNGSVLFAGGSDTPNHYIASSELYLTAPLLLNISTRLAIQSADNAMIGGFIITGAQPKTVIVRGIGPSLALPGGLADPVIEVHGSAGQLLATNDDWRSDPNHQQVIDSGLAPTDERESALWGIINPGAYTVVVRGKNDTTGIGLFEVYDLNHTVNSELANVSTRGLVQTGNNVMIGGVIVAPGTGGREMNVILRALGPSVPVTGNLSDPRLMLHDGNGALIDSNDNWKLRSNGTSQQAEIEATGIPPTNDLESALLQNLPPGNYTAIVGGKDGATGIALIEAYNLH